MPHDHFTKVLLAAIEEGLSSLGDSPRKAIYYHLEASFQLKKDDIPLNITDFKIALERIFGPGAPYIEKIIMQSLYEKLGLRYEDMQDKDIVVLVDDARKRILRAGEVNVSE